MEKDIAKRRQEIIGKIDANLARQFGRTRENASQHQIYVALSMTLRDEIMGRYTLARKLEREQQPKKLYYLSVEFLQGRALGNNLIALDEEKMHRELLAELGFSLNTLEEMEPDPGLGNGGLGRLASCFLDSLATLDYAAVGCGIRYEYGLFRQLIVDGQQMEVPDAWLDATDGQYPWEFMMSDDAVDVRFGGQVAEHWEEGRLVVDHTAYQLVRAVPYDIPIAGYRTENISRLRLWRAVAPQRLDMDSFSRGEYASATASRDFAEVISKVLYPNENHREGKSLRLKQHYFFTSATIQYILSSFKREYGPDWKQLGEKICIQINDTHPALAIPEMMRILMDEEGLSWEDAWDCVTSTFNYTNHTVMAEALERWPEDLFRELLPRIFMIVNGINERYCAKLWDYFPGQWERIGNMAIVGYNEVRMANLCIAASSHINGVSQLHAEILRQDVFRDAFVVSPWKFLGITNGVTPRRWLMDANPGLSSLLDETIGTGWREDLTQLKKAEPLAEDPAFRAAYGAVKRQNKVRLAEWLKNHQGAVIDPDMIFDVQAKRLHEYKRQLMNILHVISLYDKLMADPNYEMRPTCFLFGAKASAGYHIAKQIIRLICTVAETIDAAPAHVREKIKVVFVENYNVSAAEQLIPAADVSEQISTAGKEASGTGNIKFMINGALTLGTYDGANVEIAAAVGEENMYIFGKRAQEVARLFADKSYSPGKLYSQHEEIRNMLDYLVNGKLGAQQDQKFNDLYQVLLFGENRGMPDPYLVLLDGIDYARAQAQVNADYADRENWLKRTIRNTARSGFFSSDRCIEDYNQNIWHLNKLRF